jgi:hypothetical protein
MPGGARRRAASWLAAVVGLGAACAIARPAPPQPATADVQPLPRSSIAALLEHRAELGLRDDQIAGLTAVDDELARANDRLRASAETQLDRGGSGAADNRDQQPDRGKPCRCRSCGGKPAASGADDQRVHDRLQELVDDNDQRAFARIEPLLDPGQRAIACAIVARYREQLRARRQERGR